MVSETLLTKPQEKIERPFTIPITLSGRQAVIVNQEFGLRLKYVSRHPIAHVKLFGYKLSTEAALEDQLSTVDEPNDSKPQDIETRNIKLDPYGRKTVSIGNDYQLSLSGVEVNAHQATFQLESAKPIDPVKIIEQNEMIENYLGANAA